MCSRARRRSVWMSDRKAPLAITFLSVAYLLVLPVADLRSAEAYFDLMLALSFSYLALASFSQALSCLPLFRSHFSFVTLYSCSALASSTLRACACEGSYLLSSSALATFSLPLASASHTSFSLSFMRSHWTLAAL